jgi:PhnB protein
MAIKNARTDAQAVVANLIVTDVDRAIDFYTAGLGGRLLFRAGMPDGPADHAQLEVGVSVLLLTRENPDAHPEVVLRAPSTLSGASVILELYVDDVEAAVKRAVAAGAQLSLPVHGTFFGDRRAHVIDPFGHVWALATADEVLETEEVFRRAAGLT